MNTAIKWVATAFLALAGAVALPARGMAQAVVAGKVKDIGFEQKLGDRLPLDLTFSDDSGRLIKLGDLLGKRPIVLAPVYYRCPLLCNQLLTGLTRSLKPMKATTGVDYDLVAFSFDPEDEPSVAHAKKAGYLERYGRPGAEKGWHFLMGDQAAIEALSKAIGFRYTYNPQTKLYAHASGVVVVTPDGRIARYFYGVDFPTRELEGEIARAASNQIGSPIGKLLLLCYDYDAATGKYTLSILRLIRVLGSATALALFGFMFVMFRRDYQGKVGRSSGLDTTPNGPGPNNS